MTNSTIKRAMLQGGTALQALALLGAGFVFAASPAAAQTGTPPQQDGTAPAQDVPGPQPATSPEEDSEDAEDIVVTGSIFRGSTADTVSPITVLTAEDLDTRGINTVQEAIQQITSNNGPALTNSFSSNGAFAAGASAVSLRGLSTNSTLVLFDGQRAAYYPLADDGSRNFVDLNTIPDDIVERIEVLRDGASSTYGADAIAGVVNIITKREFQGVGGRAEAGISEDGNNANYRLSLTAGIGDLDEQGFNGYVSGFYFKQDATYARDLPYPFNTSDETGICSDRTGEEVCGPNNIINSRNPDTGLLSAFLVPYDVYVRPVLGDNSAQVPGSRFQLLNPAADCRYGPGYNLNATELATPALAAAPNRVCTVDTVNDFVVTSPNIERFGGSARFTAKIGDDAEAYAMVNFQQSTVDYTGSPRPIRDQANAGILFRPFSTAAGPAPNLAPGSAELRLPVFVCPTGVGSANGLGTGCTATTPGARLNPNNPFAAQGQLARILGRPFNVDTYNETRSRVYRAALGVSGSFWDDWDYRVEATANHNDLRRTQNGYIFIGNLLTSIAQGTVNLVNPELNSQQTMDFIMPDNITDASSDLYAAQATISTALFELPGGPLQVGFGGQIRYEAVDAPSANPDTNGPTQRYFTLNAFGTSGNRTVYSAFGELNAPIIDQIEVSASGRFDSYSSGQESFSPKVGLKITPIPQVTLRATYSEGFRIPAFGESNALPTTGFVTTNQSNFTDSFLAQYGCSLATYSSCPTYIRNNSYGLTTLASPDLQPEESRSYTAGIVVAPVSNIRFTVDYFDIKKTGAITSPSNAPALAAYYGGQPIPAGYNVIPGAPDINNPTAQPIIGFIEAQLVNANTIRAKGLDFAGYASFDFADEVSFTSSIEASYIIELSTTFPDGTKEQYEGTLGNYNLTAGSGTPEWRGSWQNSFQYRDITVSATANYFDGYNLSAEDQGGERGDCGLGVDYAPCDVGSYTTVDLTTQFKVNDDFTFYVNVLNLLNDLPDVDPATYGAYLYNPVQGGTGIFGRQFRAGVRVGF